MIERLGPGGVEARAVLERLSPGRAPDVSARRALLLALGEFGEDRLPRVEREALVPRLLEWYRDDPDPGIHGAAGGLLRQWQQQGKVEAINRELATDPPPPHDEPTAAAQRPRLPGGTGLDGAGGAQALHQRCPEKPPALARGVVTN